MKKGKKIVICDNNKECCSTRPAGNEGKAEAAEK